MQLFTFYSGSADITLQVFRRAPHEAIDLISALLEYTPTQRLRAIEAMCHPFFDELRDPNTRLPDSRHPSNPARDLPNLFDFSHHGMLIYAHQRFMTNLYRTFNRPRAEQSIGPRACQSSSGGPWIGYRQLHADPARRDASPSRLIYSIFLCCHAERTNPYSNLGC